MSRRDALLAEMGLAPVWRLRNKGKNPRDLWIELKQAVPACTACGLHKTRKQTVLGVGGIVIPIAFAAVVAGASWRLAFLASAGCALVGAVLLRPLVEL